MSGARAAEPGAPAPGGAAPGRAGADEADEAGAAGVAAPPARRPRRHDPGRRDRLIDAALTVIAERGVAATTHREIARVADVPLGSMTYHFASLDDVLVEAFTRHADVIATAFDRRMDAAPDRDAAVEQVVALVAEDLIGSPTDLVLTVEIYGAAARKPALRAVTQAWMRRSHQALERHFDPTTARELDALLIGLVLSGALSTEPTTVDQIRHAVHRIVR